MKNWYIVIRNLMPSSKIWLIFLMDISVGKFLCQIFPKSLKNRDFFVGVQKYLKIDLSVAKRSYKWLNWWGFIKMNALSRILRQFTFLFFLWKFDLKLKCFSNQVTRIIQTKILDIKLPWKILKTCLSELY